MSRWEKMIFLSKEQNISLYYEGLRDVSVSSHVTKLIIIGMMNMKIILRILTLFIFGVLLAGCGTMPSGHGWGEDVHFPNWSQIKRSALNAASDPETWVPAAGALVFSIGNLDEEVSDWASRETPIFGSQKTASNASDDLRDALGIASIVTVLATPSGDTSEEWLANKFKGLLVEGAAAGVVSETKTFLKKETNRTRPDGSDTLSFPSGHTTQAYTASTLASRNVDTMRLSSGTKKFMRISFKTMAAGTAWARVEAKAHYPSDVLAGAAIANFLTAFIHDAFMGLDNDTQIRVTTDRDGVRMMQFSWQFY